MDKSLIADIHRLPHWEAWPKIFGPLALFAEPIRQDLADAKTTERDRAIKPLDDVLAGSAGICGHRSKCVTKNRRCSESILATPDNTESHPDSGCIVARRPWILKVAAGLHRSAGATASELPGDTIVCSPWVWAAPDCKTTRE